MYETPYERQQDGYSHYGVLGLFQDTSLENIEIAVRILRGIHKEDPLSMGAINEAARVLLSPPFKASYDRGLQIAFYKELRDNLAWEEAEAKAKNSAPSPTGF